MAKTTKAKKPRITPNGKKYPCPKCGSPRVHRCKTGLCLHCDVCEHVYFPGQLDVGKRSSAQFARGAIETKLSKDTWLVLARDAIKELTEAATTIMQRQDESEAVDELAKELRLGIVVERLKRRESALDGQLEMFT